MIAKEKIISFLFKDFYQTFSEYKNAIKEKENKIKELRTYSLILNNIKDILKSNKTIVGVEEKENNEYIIIYRNLDDPTVHVVNALNPNIKLARILAGYEKKI